jgi:hypothetical protein
MPPKLGELGVTCVDPLPTEQHNFHIFAGPLRHCGAFHQNSILDSHLNDLGADLCEFYRVLSKFRSVR